MELVLTLQEETHLRVMCDDRDSHTADLRPLLFPNEQEATQGIVHDPAAYGKKIYAALFPPNTIAQQALANMPERLLLVAQDPVLDAIAWEYAYGPFGADTLTETFLVLECHVVRGLPAPQRIALPPQDQSLHLIAVPSNPLSDDIEPLAIEAEWMRLKEIVQQMPSALTLERTIPPTVERVRQQVANQKGRIIHFMGHGGQDVQQGAMLCFEQDNGALHLVTAKEFVQRVRGTTFLVTLNACISATPGPTAFHNLAAALVRQKTPYALGMRFSIVDEDARTFSRVFYSDLARGSSVEEALFQARLTLSRSPRSWVVGIPVLYTSLAMPSAGFMYQEGKPTIIEHRPHMEVSSLPRAEGVFQGRIEDLKHLGTLLTGDKRPRVLALHGGGGQGKTALAREIVERFAYAWPGGVWATTLEKLPDRAIFTTALARFLGIHTQEIHDPDEMERHVFARLASRRILLVLDNAETLIDAVEANNTKAIQLGQFLQQLPNSSVSLLVTSRVQLGWAEEVSHELGGLSPKEGADLFQQCAPQRANEIDRVLGWKLSETLEGHPLSLRLLGSAFNASHLPLAPFIHEHEAQLLQAENKYRDLGHRHRSLYACIETSVRYLNTDLYHLLSHLWIFHTPFLEETAVALFDEEAKETESTHSMVDDQLHTLWQRGLLERRPIPIPDGTLLFYYLLPTTRPYIEQHMKIHSSSEPLLARFGKQYAHIANFIFGEINRSAAAMTIAQQTEADLERGLAYVTGIEQGYYQAHLGWILYRLGAPQPGLKLLEQALESAQGYEDSLTAGTLSILVLLYQGIGQPLRALGLGEQALSIARKRGDRTGEATTLNNMAMAYDAIGQSQQALRLYQQALPIIHELGDRTGEAAALNNMAAAYDAIGQPQRALQLYEQALPIRHEVNDRAGEADTLHNMACVYQTIGQPQRALHLHEQALPIAREVGNRAGEAAILNSMAAMYNATGQPQQALRVCEQVLPITREVGNRAEEATTLGNMVSAYRVIGQPQQALNVSKQALLIRREINDRVGEANTLNNMALVYRAIGQPQHALNLYEQTLLIRREVQDRAGEATTLHNMAVVYRIMEQPQHALNLYEQALLIRREVQDRAGEATTLNNIAVVYRVIGQTQQALSMCEQALLIMREVDDAAGEAATLSSLAGLYQDMSHYAQAQAAFEQSIQLAHQGEYPATEAAALVGLSLLLSRYLHRTEAAIQYIEQAIGILEQTGLPQDAAGTTLEHMRHLRETIQSGLSSTPQTSGSTTIPTETIQQIVIVTIAVMTEITEKHDPWRTRVVKAQQAAQQQGPDRQIEVDFYTAILTILDGQSPTLSPDHPYAQAIQAIQNGIATTQGETI